MLNPSYKTEIRQTIRLAIPIIVAQLGVVLMGVADNIMVGRFLGKTALGSAGIANAIAFLIASICVGGMAVVAPMVSKAKAENNPSEVNRLFRASVQVATGFSVVLSVVAFAVAYFFEIFDQPEVINQQAPYFLVLITLSNIPLFYFVALKQLTDGLSFTSVAMIITILGLLFNVGMNYCLINGFWIFPKFGLYGAAYATLLTRLLMLVGILVYLYRQQRFKRYFVRKFAQNPIRTLVIRIFKLSVPSGFQLFFEVGAFAFAVVMMGWLGEVEMAAHQVAINIASVFYMMATGIAFAGGIRVGEARGLRNKHQLTVAGNSCFLLTIVFMLICVAIVMLFKEQLVLLYINDADVLTIAIQLLIIASLFQLSDGLQVAGLSLLRGLSDVNIPTIVTFLAYWGIALPVGYVLAFRLGYRAEGVWVGLLLGLTASAVMLISRFYWMLKRMKV